MFAQASDERVLRLRLVVEKLTNEFVFVSAAANVREPRCVPAGLRAQRPR
jgi:hypothetical protein